MTGNNLSCGMPMPNLVYFVFAFVSISEDMDIGAGIGDTVEGTGFVTTLEECLPKGVIDGTYFFNKDEGGLGIKKGSKVEFVARRTDQTAQWVVTSIKLYVSPEDQEKKLRRRFLSIIGRVARIQDGVAHVKYGRSMDKDVQQVPVSCLPKDYSVWIGSILFQTHN